ncbi:MAG: protein kinase [Candidatus Kapabacteria bacterium]|nr:protein kinase [Candidatus Kapabacteria bacterium]
MEDLSGKVLKHYYIDSKVNEGGMGEVYKAIDRNLNRNVAIKVISQKLDDHNAINRFKQEAYMASQLDHQNICTIIEIDQNEEGFYYIVMLWNDGQSLSDLIKNSELTIDDSVNYIKQCFLGLSAAHKKGILHLDIKPANLMINTDGSLKIVDFGLSRLEREIPAYELDELYGTAAYMSPEQALGKKVDNRSDIWSAGVVLYECLTGEVPFKGDYEEAIIYSIINEEPIKPSFINPNVPEYLDNIVLKCLEKNPDNRYHTCEDVIKDLDNYITGTYLKTATYDKPIRQKSYIDKVLEKGFLSKLSKSQLLLISLGVFLIIFTLLYFFTNSFEPKGVDIESDEFKRVAILKFDFINSKEDDEIFSKGFTYNLADNLAQFQNYGKYLSIISPNEIFENQIKTISAAREKFNANIAISGTFMRRGQEIQLTLRLYDKDMITQKTRIIVESDNRKSLLQDSAFTIVANMLGIDYALASKQTKILPPPTFSEKAYELYIKGLAYLGRYERIENINQAISLFEEAIKNDNTYALAYAGLSEAYWYKYDITYDKADANLAELNSKKAVELAPDYHQTLLAMGNTYSQIGAFNKAIEVYSKILKANPSNSKALLKIAIAYENANQFDLAEKNYKRAIMYDSLEWSKYNNLGFFYRFRGQYDKAIEMFKKVIELTKDNDRGYNNIAGIYIMQRKFNDAFEYLDKALKINNKNPDTYNNRAAAYFLMHKPKEAAEEYEKALKLDKPSFVYYGNLAEAYHYIPNMKQKEQENLLKAIKLAEDMIKINPNNSSVLASLSNYYIFLGNKQKSEEYINKALTLSPETPVVLLKAAVNKEVSGDRNKALEFVRKYFLANGPKVDIFNSIRLSKLREDPRFKEMIK